MHFKIFIREGVEFSVPLFHNSVFFLFNRKMSVKKYDGYYYSEIVVFGSRKCMSADRVLLYKS